MENQSDQQLELFSQDKKYGQPNASGSGRSRFIRFRGYEKIIFIIFGLTAISIVSFSLGVEKGKHAMLKLAQPAPLPMVTQPAVSVETTKIEVPVQQVAQGPVIKEDAKQNSLKPVETQGFTIQLASYKTMTFAQKEAQLLKQKGFSPLILSKGDYIVLCVGNFSDKAKAQTLLVELKKRYKGCYVRRL